MPGDGAALRAGGGAYFEVEDVGGEETSGVESGAEEEEVEVWVAKDFVTLETYGGSVGGVDDGGMGGEGLDDGAPGGFGRGGGRAAGEEEGCDEGEELHWRSVIIVRKFLFQL